MLTFKEFNDPKNEQLRAKLAKAAKDKKALLKKARDQVAKSKAAKAAGKIGKAVTAPVRAAKALAKGAKKVALAPKKLAINMKKFAAGVKKGAKDAGSLGVAKTKDKIGYTKAKKMMEGKITWKNGIINDGTMRIGIFDPDKEKAMEAARQLIIFLRKNKKVKIGGDKEDSDGEPNEAIAKYSEELSKLVFDDEILDDLEPKGHNGDQIANDIVLKRLKDLGVNIR